MWRCYLASEGRIRPHGELSNIPDKKWRGLPCYITPNISTKEISDIQSGQEVKRLHHSRRHNAHLREVKQQSDGTKFGDVYLSSQGIIFP
jgi:hypothetical protein